MSVTTTTLTTTSVTPSLRTQNPKTHQTRRMRSASILISISALLAGCSSDDAVTTSTYDGLDAALVTEATNNGEFVSRLADQPPETKAGLAQGMVINFAVCRQMLRAYEQLLTTGTAEPLPALPRPTNPESFSYDWWIRDHESMSTAVEGRDIDAVRQWIAGEGSCGEWVPVSAAEFETIQQRVASLGSN